MKAPVELSGVERAVPRRARFLLAGAILLGLSAGQTTATALTADPSNEVGPKLGLQTRALKLFDAVSENSLPDFASIHRTVTAIGPVKKVSAGTMFSSTENLSFKIVEGPGTGKSRSMVFAMTERTSTVFQAHGSKFFKIQNTELGRMGGYRLGVRVTPVLIGAPNRRNETDYFNLRLLSEARIIRDL